MDHQLLSRLLLPSNPMAQLGMQYGRDMVQGSIAKYMPGQRRDGVTRCGAPAQAHMRPS